MAESEKPQQIEKMKRTPFVCYRRRHTSLDGLAGQVNTGPPLLDGEGNQLSGDVGSADGHDQVLHTV